MSATAPKTPPVVVAGVVVARVVVLVLVLVRGALGGLDAQHGLAGLDLVDVLDQPKDVVRLDQPLQCGGAGVVGRDQLGLLLALVVVQVGVRVVDLLQRGGLQGGDVLHLHGQLNSQTQIAFSARFITHGGNPSAW